MKTQSQKEIEGTARKDRNKTEVIATLDKLPKPPSFFKATPRKRKIYKFLGEGLINAKLLTELDTMVLWMLTDAVDQYVWAITEIERKNEETPGSGYIQTFASSASNISAEMSVKRDALKTIVELASKFGLTIKDRRGIMGADPAQLELDLFNEFNLSGLKAV